MAACARRLIRSGDATFLQKLTEEEQAALQQMLKKLLADE